MSCDFFVVFRVVQFDLFYVFVVVVFHSTISCDFGWFCIILFGFVAISFFYEICGVL